MSFLRVNGWAIPMRDQSAEEEHVMGGDFARSFSGSPLSDERFDKRIWSGQTPPVTEMVALAIRGAVRGLGHLWSFDSDLYSSKGLTPGSTVGSRRIATAADGSSVVSSDNVAESKFGAYSGTVEPGCTNLLTQNQRDGTEAAATTVFTGLATGGLTSVTTQKLQGSRSLRVVTFASQDGVETTTNACSALTSYAGSAYVWTVADRSVKLELYDNIAGTLISTVFTARAGKWTRLAVVATTTAGATTLQLRFRDNEAGGATFYLDALQLEAGSIATTWADGTRAAGDLGYNPSLVTSAMDFTFNAWVRMPTANPSSGSTLASFGLLAGTFVTNYCFIYRAGAANSIVFETAGSASSTLTYSTNPWNGAWRMVTCVFRKNPETGENGKEIYIDGALVTSSSPASTAFPDLSQATNFHLGSYAGSLFRLGALSDSLMDDAMFLPYAAPADQIAAWYNMGEAMPPLSRVYADGGAVADSALTVLAEGRADMAKYVSAHKSSAWRDNLRVVDLELWEV